MKCIHCKKTGKYWSTIEIIMLSREVIKVCIYCCHKYYKQMVFPEDWSKI